MDVSIIIPVYNEEDRIGDLLNKLRNQVTMLTYEVIVVDNGSTDSTVSTCEKFGVRTLFIENKFTIAAVRNYGAKFSKGDVLVFLDADCLPSDTWLDIGFKKLKKCGEICCAVGGPYVPSSTATWVQKAWHSLRPLDSHNANYISGGNFFISNILFSKIKGFNSALETGEDYELCYRLRNQKGCCVISDKDLSIIHFGDPKSLKERMLKEVWYGKEIINIYKGDKMSLSFWATIGFIILFTCFLYFLLIFSAKLSLLFGVAILCTLLSVCIYKCYRVKNFKYLIPLIVIFFFYFLGRSIALVNEVIIMLKNKTCTVV